MKPAGLATIPGAPRTTACWSGWGGSSGCHQPAATTRACASSIASTRTPAASCCSPSTSPRSGTSPTSSRTTRFRRNIWRWCAAARDAEKAKSTPHWPATRRPGADGDRQARRAARANWVESRAAFRDCTLLRVFPKTGKTHQIRVHLQLDRPAAGDRPALQRRRQRRPPGLMLSAFKRGYRPRGGEAGAPADGPTDAARGEAAVHRPGRRGSGTCRRRCRRTFGRR